MRQNHLLALLGLAAAAPLGAALADSVTLKLIPERATSRAGGYAPQRLALTAERPAALKKAPELSAPLYGVLKLGPVESPSSFLLAVDEPEAGPARLYVDTNGNGDLTDDPAVTWSKRAYKVAGGQELSQHSGSLQVELPDGASKVVVSLGAYRFDKNDPQRAALRDVLLYYTDFGREGEIRLGEKTYKVMLVDFTGTGDFRGKPSERGNGIRLMIDVNGNGRFDSRGEAYDTAKPFNIGGTTYEVKSVAPSGATLEIGKSEKVAEQILPPPDLGPGKPALAFTAKTTAGQEIRFPSSYKGKLVLLDFWATWCGPCIVELPHLKAAYEKYHPKGLEVLGISLDQENAAEKLATFTKQREMPWPQVYDGKFWNAAVAQLYAVDSIPRAYLVDGDTGKIVASGADLRGPRLLETVEKALASR